MTVRRLVVLLLSGSVLASLGAQANRANPDQVPYRGLEEVVSKLQWDAAKSGPLIVPCPLMVKHGLTLEEWDRKKMTVGGVTVIAPQKMVTIDSRFKEAPNLYDGLPRAAKVTYLLTLLNDEQWRKLTGAGLSLSDCQGEQVDVMQSILPNPFRYREATIASSNSATLSDAKTAKQLPNDQRRMVKLRVVKSLELILPLENDGGFTGTSVSDNRTIGAKLPYLDEDDADAYGHLVKIESDNRLRQSQLNYQAPQFKAKLPLKSGEKLSELLDRIANATGIELYADMRYAPMPMVETGTEASIADLLQAIALGVTGTYRRVGTAYVLTQDLVGIGAHKARIAVWEDDIEKVIEERTSLWKSVLAKMGRQNKIRFKSGAYDSLTQAELKNIEANDRPNVYENSYIDVSSASPAVRREVQEAANRFRGTKIDTQKVGVHSATYFELILPDGSVPWNIGWLANTDQYNPKPYVWQPKKPSGTALPLAASGFRGLVFRADSPQVALDHVERAARYGVKELWLETRSPAALKAAIGDAPGKGVKVNLVIRPWAIPDATVSDANRTVAGDHGKAFGAEKLNYLALQKFWMDIAAFEPPTRELAVPVHSAASSRWPEFASLAATPGLGDVVLLDTYPTGYGQKTSRSSGSYFYSTATDAYLSYGFSVASRLAFLRKEHVDPVDIDDDMLRTKAEFRDIWGGGWGGGDLNEKWQTAKSAEIREAVSQLVTRLGEARRPVYMEGQPDKVHIPPFGSQFLFQLRSGSTLPTTPEDYIGDETRKSADLEVVNVMETSDLDQRDRVADRVKRLVTKGVKPVVLDFSDVPLAKLDGLLKDWLRKAEK